MLSKNFTEVQPESTEALQQGPQMPTLAPIHIDPQAKPATPAQTFQGSPYTTGRNPLVGLTDEEHAVAIETVAAFRMNGWRGVGDACIDHLHEPTTAKPSRNFSLEIGRVPSVDALVHWAESAGDAVRDLTVLTQAMIFALSEATKHKLAREAETDNKLKN